MIGNDIVDLSLAAIESNWRRKGFLEKVFSREERTMIFSARDSTKMVWLLWSFKEAAYKAHQRITGHPPILNWLRQNCELSSWTNTSALGVVTVDGNKYYTTSEVTCEYIHTTAGKYKLIPVNNVLFEGPSQEAKAQFLKLISNHFSIPVQHLTFQKCELGIPYVQYHGRAFYRNFSFSDHGRFNAFSLPLRIS